VLIYGSFFFSSEEPTSSQPAFDFSLFLAIGGIFTTEKEDFRIDSEVRREGAHPL